MPEIVAKKFPHVPLNEFRSMCSNLATGGGAAFEIALTVGSSPGFSNVSLQEWNPEKMNTRIDRRRSEVKLARMDMNDNSVRRPTAREQCER
jgi:hypothetical protein